jgi:hypothetical protein
VVLWDLSTRQRLAGQPFPVAKGKVWSVAFSPDGKTLTAGFGHGGDVVGGVVLWDLDLNSWLRLAGHIANRNLTREEFRVYFPDETEYRKTFSDLPAPPEPSPKDPRFRPAGARTQGTESGL